KRERRQAAVMSRGQNGPALIARSGAGFFVFRALRDPGGRKLARQATGKPNGQHAKVAKERPERVAERRRPVLLDRKMREPRGRIAEDNRRDRQPGRAQDNCAQDAKDRETGPEKVPAAGLRTCML